MANVTATLTFALPEDQDADQIKVYASNVADGVYQQVHETKYHYGETDIQLNFDDAYWYKIQFVNTKSTEVGPMSDPVFGGSFSNAAPFLAVSTKTDGANYATTQDVYEYSGLTAEDVKPSQISQALRRSRALIDYRTAEMDLDRFDAFNVDTARRKYNATLRILKEAEINIALGNGYTNLSDDIIIEAMRGESSSAAGSVSIGSTTVSGDAFAERNENILFLAALADKYFTIGERLLSTLDTNSVRLVPNEFVTRVPRFRYPFNGH